MTETAEFYTLPARQRFAAQCDRDPSFRRYFINFLEYNMQDHFDCWVSGEEIYRLYMMGALTPDGIDDNSLQVQQNRNIGTIYARDNTFGPLRLPPGTSYSTEKVDVIAPPVTINGPVNPVPSPSPYVFTVSNRLGRLPVIPEPVSVSMISSFNRSAKISIEGQPNRPSSTQVAPSNGSQNQTQASNNSKTAQNNKSNGTKNNASQSNGNNKQSAAVQNTAQAQLSWTPKWD